MLNWILVAVVLRCLKSFVPDKKVEVIDATFFSGGGARRRRADAVVNRDARGDDEGGLGVACIAELGVTRAVVHDNGGAVCHVGCGAKETRGREVW
jgi:hypothetical protein